MRGKKAWLAGVWGSKGLAELSLQLRLPPRRTLPILAYHRVLDLPKEDDFPGDPELVSASATDFERQMRFVRKHFTPLRFADVLSLQESGKPLPRNALIVTFDDGHIDNYTHAFPILKSLGVPATIFISTAYIDAPETPFWFDHIAQLVYFAPAGPLRVDALDHQATLSNVASRRDTTYQILQRIKREPNTRRLTAMNELIEKLGSHIPAALRAQRAAMNWQEVREMAAAGIEFGSHTVTHPVLSQLDEAAITQELSVSRDIIRKQTGQAVDTVAYPVGKSMAFDDRVIKATKACGYRLGVSYETGVNRASGFDQFALRRLAVERYVSFDHFKSMLSLPEIFA